MSLFHYFITYNIIILIYLWFRYFPIILYDKPKYTDYIGENSVTVIIPSFNEKYEEILETVQHAKLCEEAKQIIVVDDGSDDLETVKKISRIDGIEFYRLPKNKGKRHAQKVGFNNAKYDIIVTLDSDTNLVENSIHEILKPFNDKKIGAVTGMSYAKNPNENLLTRLIDARYNSAFKIERYGQSFFGTVVCCCGSFSAYRKIIIDNLEDKYINQHFLGYPCNFGDDRHLTNLMLEQGHKIVFYEEAKAYTTVPNNMKQFLKQQLRWSQSFFRENFITMKYMFKRSKYLTMDVILSALLPSFSLIARVYMVYSVIVYPELILYYILMVFSIASIRNLTIIETKKQFWYYGLYGFLHNFVLYWLYFIAIWKVLVQKDFNWGTR